jgi:hypothetical protein
LFIFHPTPSSKILNPHKNNQLARFITIGRKPDSAYAQALSFRTNTVEQSVDNPFMIAAAPWPVWLIVNCSFFDQSSPGNSEPDQRLRPKWCLVLN